MSAKREALYELRTQREFRVLMANIETPLSRLSSQLYHNGKSLFLRRVNSESLETIHLSGSTYFRRHSRRENTCRCFARGHFKPRPSVALIKTRPIRMAGSSCVGIMRFENRIADPQFWLSVIKNTIFSAVVGAHQLANGITLNDDTLCRTTTRRLRPVSSNRQEP